MNAKSICFSLISHGHGAMVTNLIAQLDACDSLYGAKFILTVNLKNEKIYIPNLKNLDLELHINDEKKGFGENHNNAFKRYETCNWFIILNPDLEILEKKPFHKLLNFVNEHSTDESPIGLASPLVLNPNLQVEDFRRSTLTPFSLFQRRFMIKKEDFKDSREDGFFWLAGMCLVINPAVFKGVSGFDERYFLYCEDFDLSLRVYQAGARICVIDTERIIHNAQRKSRTSSRFFIMHISSLLKVWLSRPFWRYVLNK